MVSTSGQSKDKQKEDEYLEIAKSRLKLEGKSGLTEYQRKLIEWSENVDQGYAWVVLGALFICMCSVLGTYRIYGLVFAKVTTDGIYTRQEASWPVSMIYTAETLMGPLVSLGTYYLSIRLTLLTGGVLITLGNLMTYFSDNLWTDVIFLGFVQGIGYSFVLTPLLEIINNYFLRYRNVALGLVLCGGTVAIFAWSPIAQYILDNYPWRTAYLGISLMCSLVLLMAPLVKPNPKPNFRDYISVENAENVGLHYNWPIRNSLSRMSSRALQSTMLITRMASLDPKSGMVRQESIISMNPFASTAGIERKISRTLTDWTEPVQSIFAIDYEQNKMNLACDKQQLSTNRKLISKTSIHSLESHLVLDTTELTVDELHNSQLKAINKSQPDSLSIMSDAIRLEMHTGHEHHEFGSELIWFIVRKPAFHLIWFMVLIYYWNFCVYYLVLVDLGRDHGCTMEQADSLVSFQSIGELIGRLVLTFIVDFHYLSNKNVVILDLFLLSGTLVLISQVSGFIWMAVLTVVFTSLISLFYIMLNGLLVDYLGERNVTLVYGMSCFISGILMSFRPQAVGFFRDQLGSYEWLLISLALVNVIGALLWIIEPLLTRHFDKEGIKEEATSGFGDDNYNKKIGDLKK